MKALAILALITTGLTLSSCACKGGKCIFSKKKTADSCCSSGAAAKKGAAGSCCSH